jgi:hypothetical protein
LWQSGVGAPREGRTNALATLLSDAERRRDRHKADYAAFIAEHGRDIGDLSREEARELFSILLMQAGLDAEMRVLKNLVGRLSR